MLILRSRATNKPGFFLLSISMKKKVAVIRKEHFNAAHRLYNKQWSDEHNYEVFDKCSNPNYHGHNYNLEVKVIGEVDPVTGYVVDLKWLSTLINDKVIEKFDHKNLNLDLPEFSDLNPTVENIAVVIYDILRQEIAEHFDLQIRLYETERNFVDYPA
jgi:6-pyruvoyltetrahydropterin/6-carboxytetrahydropterin synthase